MAFGQNITFNLSQNNLGSPQQGLDYVSGIIFVASTLPTGFSYSVAKQIFSVNGAETLGIVGDWSDETLATGTVSVVSGTLSVGTSVTLTIDEPDVNGTLNTLTLGSYTSTAVISGTSFAGSLANSVNFTGSGYSATVVGTSSNIQVTAREGVGALINGVSITSSTSSVATTTAFVSGVSSVRKLEHYQISEFFRTNINGALWVMYVQSLGDFSAINLMQNQASGEIRQIGIYNNDATANSTITSDLDAIQAQGAVVTSDYTPVSIIYAPNLYSYSDLSLLPNLRQRSDWYTSCVIGQDGEGLGAFLSIYASKSIPCYGAVLGQLSKSKVSENIGWVGGYNLVTGTELALPALSNKALYKTTFANSRALLTQLDASGYIFLMSRPGISGTWVNDTHTAVAKTSDFAYIERVRTIYKVLRESYTGLVPLVNSSLILDSAGLMKPSTIAIFEEAMAPNLNEMVRKEEISDYAIIIDPTQNVQSTSTVNVIIRIIGIGIARNIVVDLGFALSL